SPVEDHIHGLPPLFMKSRNIGPLVSAALKFMEGYLVNIVTNMEIRFPAI
ncbi:hypothetical protein AVEN_213206-1, partial [Araneus ventricosus]